MRLIEHFDDVLVLNDVPGGADGLIAALRTNGITAWPVDLAAPDPWRAWPGRTHRDAGEASKNLGVLIIDARVPAAERFWSTQDGLVEQLEGGRHAMVVLAHGEVGEATDPTRAPRLLPTDGVPSRPQALAVGRSLLRRLLDLLPDRGHAAPLASEDWLTMAVWMVPAVQQGMRRAFAWPSVAAVSAVAPPNTLLAPR